MMIPVNPALLQDISPLQVLVLIIHSLVQQKKKVTGFMSSREIHFVLSYKGILTKIQTVPFNDVKNSLPCTICGLQISRS